MDHVSRWFGDVVALASVSFVVGPGVTALLGPNGAGKSTLVRILCGLLTPSQGKVRVLDTTPRRDLRLYRHLGYVPEPEAIFESVTARHLVRVAASLQGLPQPDQAAADVLRLVELDPGDRRPLRTYSKGMRQRVKVAAALVHDPQVLILDEPLNGLDPRQRHNLIALFRRLGGEGRCVLVSSHVLAEVERLGSRVLVLVDGKLAAEGDFHAIRDLMEDRPRRLRLRTDAPHALAAGLLGSELVSGAHLGGDGILFVDTRQVTRFRHELPRIARSCDARLLELVPLDEDLDSVFRYLVRGAT